MLHTKLLFPSLTVTCLSAKKKMSSSLDLMTMRRAHIPRKSQLGLGLLIFIKLLLHNQREEEPLKEMLKL